MMGIPYADIALIRAADLVQVQEGYLAEDQVRRVQVTALGDSDASMLAVPRSLVRPLNLRINLRKGPIEGWAMPTLPNPTCSGESPLTPLKLT